MIYGNGFPSNNKGNYPAVELGCYSTLNFIFILNSLLTLYKLYLIPHRTLTLSKLYFIISKVSLIVSSNTSTSSTIDVHFVNGTRVYRPSVNTPN